MPLYFYLLSLALLCNAPLVLMIRLFRGRMPLSVGRSLLALGFAATTSYGLWRLEWYDVFRHGFPHNPSLLVTYVIIILTYASVGWWLAGIVTRQSVLSTRASVSE